MFAYLGYLKPISNSFLFIRVFSKVGLFLIFWLSDMTVQGHDELSRNLDKGCRVQHVHMNAWAIFLRRNCWSLSCEQTSFINSCAQRAPRPLVCRSLRERAVRNA